ncbi:MAG TPA: hypothetical protein VHD32_03135 [Candidatus Didemnitutus sp.]|nr:hypothetical protein [Candidatus Didemnitutus sp.]
MNRREFLQQSGAAVAFAALYGVVGRAATLEDKVVALVYPTDDPVVGAPSVKWALELLGQAITQRGLRLRITNSIKLAEGADFCLLAAGPGGAFGRPADAAPATAPESLAIVPGKLDGRDVLWISGSDARGLMYALTEVADAVALGIDSTQALRPLQPVRESPPNQVRSVIRLFASDVEDKGWFNDRDFWRGYFGLLAANRFNRFSLGFGLGYDQPIGLRDTYFYFAYPFLVDVPGYPVRATHLPDAERDANLAMLRWISDEAAAQGLDFQLGLWTHAYRWIDSPSANHVIEGLTPETHAPYCRDALTRVLEACPNITGITLRIHGESGVPEGSYGLWRTIFDGCQRGGKRVPLDLHAKGMDQPTIDAALACGSPLTISPKFWAEHMGLPYLQAAIRPTERPTGKPGKGLFTQSEGARSFLRYGYGDLLREDRKYSVVHRIWPGTQRVLLWGDPVFAAAYGRVSSLCDVKGCEIFDPLSFKGRKGSGHPGGRDGYRDLTLRATGGDFEKYRYTHRLWGRCFYNPQTAPEIWDRQLRKDYGAAAESAGKALSLASRILPLVTTAHCPSAANNNYWPEMYVNMAIADESETPEPYTDTPKPRRFGTVSPLDPQLFSTVEEFVASVVTDKLDSRHPPTEVAQWLHRLASGAEDALRKAKRTSGENAALRRLAIDVETVIGLGRFFGEKLTAASWYALYQIEGGADTLAQALKAYRSAREHWRQVIEITIPVYVADVSYGEGWFQRGHWADRLAAIDRDIEVMARKPISSSAGPSAAAHKLDLLTRSIFRPAVVPGPLEVRRTKAGQSIEIRLTDRGGQFRSVIIYFRSMNQAEIWQSTLMRGEKRSDGTIYFAAIPASVADNNYPLQFYLEVQDDDIRPSTMPRLRLEMDQMPYIIVRASDLARPEGVAIGTGIEI